MISTVQPDPSPDAPRWCTWCEAVIPAPQDAFIDAVLTGIFGCWYCSEECRDAHLTSA